MNFLINVVIAASSLILPVAQAAVGLPVIVEKINTGARESGISQTIAVIEESDEGTQLIFNVPGSVETEYLSEIPVEATRKEIVRELLEEQDNESIEMVEALIDENVDFVVRFNGDKGEFLDIVITPQQLSRALKASSVKK